MLEQSNLGIGDNQPFNTIDEIRIPVVENRLDVCFCAFQLLPGLAINPLGVIVGLGSGLNGGDVR